MSDTKPKRIRLSPEARQQHLLDCSAEMIAADGLAGFTMEGLAKRASVSAPLVYNYFPNRIELLQTLLKRELSRFNRRTVKEAEQAKSFEEIVRMAVRSNFAHYAPCFRACFRNCLGAGFWGFVHLAASFVLSALIISAAFSAIMIVGAFKFPLVMVGMMVCPAVLVLYH